MKKRLNALLLVGAVFALAGIFVVWRTAHVGPEAAVSSMKNPYSGTLLNDQQALPNFRLQRAGGQFDNAGFAGHWTFMFFGYTQCPDVCPTALSLMKDVKTRLAVKGSSSLPQVVFVSVDPRRDNLELLSNFTTTFDPSFIGATATDEQLAPLAKHLGVFYQRNDQQDSKHYSIDHTAALYLIDPQGRLKAVFGPPQDAARMAEDFAVMAR